MPSLVREPHASEPLLAALPIGKAAGFLFLVQKQDFGPFTPN
ncbi:hypothetical protein [Anaeroarcus burkinensis]|nr:hypothetical protein [Anaeroarcus burkinensis]